MRRIEVGCGWCGQWHVVKSLAVPLHCCSVRKGVRRLIVACEDPKTGARWFNITTGTDVRVYTRDAAPTKGPAR